MINKLRNLIDLVLKFFSFTKIIISLLGVILIYLTVAFKLISKNVNINLPIWVCVIIVILAIYPILKIIEFLITKNKLKKILLFGLMWEISYKPFKKIIPFCPINNCLTEVICIQKRPPTFQITNSRLPHLGIDEKIHFRYECPHHGIINGTPDEDIEILLLKVDVAFKSAYRKMTSRKK